MIISLIPKQIFQLCVSYSGLYLTRIRKFFPVVSLLLPRSKLVSLAKSWKRWYSGDFAIVSCKDDANISTVRAFKGGQLGLLRVKDIFIILLVYLGVSGLVLMLVWIPPHGDIVPLLGIIFVRLGLVGTSFGEVVLEIILYAYPIVGLLIIAVCGWLVVLFLFALYLIV